MHFLRSPNSELGVRLPLEEWNLLYVSDMDNHKDSWGPKAFHEKCDGVGELFNLKTFYFILMV
jgi:hypothetical protein